MDTQTPMTRPYGHDQTEEPIRIHHPEEEEHHIEKGAASKVFKKVKDKAKKMKNTLTKHGHGHGEHTTGNHDVEEEDDEYEEEEPEVQGAPVYESSTVRSGVTGQPGSLIHPEETNVLASDEITPPGTKVFPVVSSKHTEPVNDSEPLGGLDPSYRDEAVSYPVRVSDLSDRGESREAHLKPMNMNTPGEDESFGQQKVKIEMPLNLKEDPVPLGGGVSNYQSKVTDPSQQGGGEAGVPGIVESLGKMKMTDESPGKTSGIGFETDLSTKNRGDDEVKVESRSRSDLPTGTHDQFSPELTRPKKREDFDSKTEETQETQKTEEPKPSTYTEKIVSATSVIADKAIAAKNAVVSKLGYTTESSGGEQETQTPRSATGYGQKVAGTVAEKLTPVYEKVKETGSNVMTKLPLSGGGSGEETQQGVSAREYLAEKLRPGEEDKALSEVIAEKLHLGGETKKITKEVTVTVEKKQEPEEEVKGGGVVEKLRGAVPSWLGGTTGEVKEKSSESTQSLGSTVGTTGFGGATVKTNQESGN